MAVLLQPDEARMKNVSTMEPRWVEPGWNALATQNWLLAYQPRLVLEAIWQDHISIQGHDATMNQLGFQCLLHEMQGPPGSQLQGSAATRYHRPVTPLEY